MTVYSYSRVSTGRQDNSLDTQAAQVRGYAMMIGTEIAAHFEDEGVSGSTRFAERAQASKLLAKLRRGDKVICAKLDRCFRSALDALDQLAWFKKHGVELHLIDMGGDVTGNGIAKLVFTILSAVAEAERDRIRERISDVKAHQRSQGRYLGGTVPFGYRCADDGILFKHADEQCAIVRMRFLRESGKSLRAIADDMRQHGFKLGHRTVADVLARSERGPFIDYTDIRENTDGSTSDRAVFAPEHMTSEPLSGSDRTSSI